MIFYDFSDFTIRIAREKPDSFNVLFDFPPIPDYRTHIRKSKRLSVFQHILYFRNGFNQFAIVNSSRNFILTISREPFSLLKFFPNWIERILCQARPVSFRGLCNKGSLIILKKELRLELAPIFHTINFSHQIRWQGKLYLIYFFRKIISSLL